jgi:hypothetical protein
MHRSPSKKNNQPTTSLTLSLSRPGMEIPSLKKYGTNPEKPFYRIWEAFVSMIAMRGASVYTQPFSVVDDAGESAIPSDIGRSSGSAEPVEVRD